MSSIKKYDIAIAYRIYPGVSKKPFIHADSKLRLTETGVHTLKRSLGRFSAKIFFLLDNCPEEYSIMISKYFDQPDIEFIRYNGIGNLATFGKQIDILIKQNDSDIVMFAEDDYVYRSFEMEKAIEFAGTPLFDNFITPYDHLDSYTLPIHTKHRYEIIFSTGLHWRTSASTCLTFLTRKATLEKTENIFRSYCKGNWDSSLWFSLTKFNVFHPGIFLLIFKDLFLAKTIILSWIHNWKQILFGRKYKLWQPIPSIATHMESGLLAPGIDWNIIAKE